MFLRAVALFFGAAAIFHLWRIVEPNPTDSSGALRHAVFVVINLVVAGCLWWRPRWLRLIFGVLVLQQVSSHGMSAWHAWAEQGEFDLISLGIVLLLPITWAVLWQSDASAPLRSRLG